MQSYLTQFYPLLLIAIIFVIISAIIWLFFDHGLDRLRHPEEYQDTGKIGEQIVFTTLRDKVHIPENQILRNVYIPTVDGKTSEIDILVISKKGLFVFECKNYGGNIYGNMRRKKWVQYLGRRKSYFYNPFLQNQSHIKHLKKYLEELGDLPTTSIVATITRGRWKVKNLGPDEHLLGYNCHLTDVYNALPDSELIARHYITIMNKLTPLSRPSEEIRNKHIENITTKNNLIFRRRSNHKRQQ